MDPIVNSTPERQIFTDSHAKSILATMNNLRKANRLCDVTLQVGEQDFPAHRIVLAACSDYFCAMFTHGVSSTQPVMCTESDLRRSTVFVPKETPDLATDPDLGSC